MWHIWLELEQGWLTCKQGTESAEETVTGLMVQPVKLPAVVPASHIGTGLQV